jgi:hypothetical protein
MNGLLQMIGQGLRKLRSNPVFTLVAIASLALGIGANAAIFQLLDAVRLRALPISNPHELAEVRIVGGNHGFGINDGIYGRLTRPIWQEIREHHEPFSGVFAWRMEDRRVGEGVESHSIAALDVSGEFFRVLGVQPWRGRLLLPEDEVSACVQPKVVASYAYWQSEMGGRDISTASGTANKLMVDGQLAEVIGVTPPEFFGLAVGQSFDLAIPFCQPKELRREVFDVSVMGRLGSNWTRPRASAQLGAISGGIFEATVPTGYSTQAVEP